MLESRTSDLDRHQVETAYARWAPVYDKVCGPLFEPGRRSATGAAMRVGGRILEVGVGTGLSFGDYNASTEVVGIDFPNRWWPRRGSAWRAVATRTSRT